MQNGYQIVENQIKYRQIYVSIDQRVLKLSRLSMHEWFEGKSTSKKWSLATHKFGKTLILLFCRSKLDSDYVLKYHDKLVFSSLFISHQA